MPAFRFAYARMVDGAGIPGRAAGTTMIRGDHKFGCHQAALGRVVLDNSRKLSRMCSAARSARAEIVAVGLTT
ncbi:MAG: hypothetical protein JWQ55_3963, partial [Rhodopila sp.]|nr:hypothetical protein [Rhodopila sp.]